jgi:hypothetical protein
MIALERHMALQLFSILTFFSISDKPLQTDQLFPCRGCIVIKNPGGTIQWRKIQDPESRVHVIQTPQFLSIDKPQR